MSKYSTFSADWYEIGWFADGRSHHDGLALQVADASAVVVIAADALVHDVRAVHVPTVVAHHQAVPAVYRLEEEGAKVLIKVTNW